MPEYKAPVRDLDFCLKEITDFKKLNDLHVFESLTDDVIDAIFQESGKLASDVMSSINHLGDKAGCIHENGIVRMPDGFKDAYKKYIEGGWNGLSFSEEIGGQGLPFTLGLAVNEMFSSANMALGLCPLLTTGAIEALSAHANHEIKEKYLPKLVSGEWTATMNLTEPQAGSDVGALRTRAILQKDGSYLISGTKIYITYGDHDLSENIIHLVLARTPEAPPGTKGISLFLVPKFLLDENGNTLEKNDLRCVSIEHKLGINASPTAVMSFGDNNGAKGWLIGEENQGMRCMFTMMNHARIGVGLQGPAIAERAYQQSFNYACDRKQGKKYGSTSKDSVPIIEHIDVRRMLISMKSQIEAMRAVYLSTGVYYDLSRHDPDFDNRKLYKGCTDLLTPVVKAWCTDIGFECASIGVQVHGGMGFIEETGAAQHLRDSRIAPIYEGTNGIQAIDLVFRKLKLDGGMPINYLIEKMKNQISFLDLESGDKDFITIKKYLSDSVSIFEKTCFCVTEYADKNFDLALSSATLFLKMFGTVYGGSLLAKGALSAKELSMLNKSENNFYKNKILIARFYSEQFLPQVNGMFESIKAGSDTLSKIDIDMMESA
tara:strand:- start:408 stop:2216 length:1809 start_codon:yes stop_codon:yes gene_type:complete